MSTVAIVLKIVAWLVGLAAAGLLLVGGWRLFLATIVGPVFFLVPMIDYDLVAEAAPPLVGGLAAVAAALVLGAFADRLGSVARRRAHRALPPKQHPDRPSPIDPAPVRYR